MQSCHNLNFVVIYAIIPPNPYYQIFRIDKRIAYYNSGQPCTLIKITIKIFSVLLFRAIFMYACKYVLPVLINGVDFLLLQVIAVRYSVEYLLLYLKLFIKYDISN